MKFIISILFIILAFSIFMALKTDYNSTQAAKEMQLEEVAKIPEKVQEVAPEPTQEEVYGGENEENLGTEEITEEEQPPYFSNIETEIADVFGTESRIALAVAKAESGLNPKAINRNRDGSKDVGIFQINDRHGWSDEERLDWKTNIRLAKELRDSRGWGEWAVYNDGTYRNYL
ncbi:MAG TPA: transglycosylase SLT domain-containing protein [Smithella sp.]|nr:transglycosylase SLT domain-containing protein [Smithella sp.]